ncbi:UDP glycosyltransferase 89A2 [Hibiscus trionum]|uniref:UDP glycosyltransferase 89A2 n=1 Tax=Hibiscus trionum TaxID=183268 RepID=A0A9W7MMZ3_HIBTR|nr:UDP glycosyltransferase 89A2 [Hibiscus trionum]
MATNASPHRHILVFPYPAQGHMLPLLDLTHQLVLRGLTITILVTPKNLPFLSTLLSSHPSSITPLVFPFPSHPLIPTGVEHVKDLGNTGNLPMMAALAKLHDPLLDWFNSHPNPPVAILSDFFLGWTQRLATSLQIPRITFFSSGAFVASVMDYIWNNVEKLKSLSEIEFRHLPGSPIIKQEHLPPGWGCVLNTFDALEAEYVQCLKAHVGHDRVFDVGPLSLTGPDVLDRGNSSSGSDLNDQVLTWLDQCPDGSVVYVSFGSQKLLRKEQMEALANGLEKSGTRFIWVVKSGTIQQQDEGYGVVPDGFEQRIARQGLYVNARLLVDDVGVGVRVCEGRDSVPDSDEVGRAIAEVITKGEGMKGKAKDLKGEALAAMSQGGSSMKNLDRFVEEVCQLGA